MPSSPTPKPSRPYSALEPDQLQAIDILYGQDAIILQAPMGSGKHVIGQTAAQELIGDGILRRVLVVTTPRIRDKVWAKEPALWEHLDPVETPQDAAQRLLAHQGDAPIVVISFDALVRDAAKVDLSTLYDGLLIDELTKGKAPAGARAKSIAKQLPRFTWRAGMTGTFGADGKPEELFGQVRWISGDLGTTATKFRQHYLVKDRYTHAWSWAPGGREKALRDIRGLVYQMPPGDYERSLPEVSHTEILCPLPADAAALQRTVLRHGVAEWQGHQLVAETAAVRQHKAHQIADGFYYDEDGETHHVHDVKVDSLRDLLVSGLVEGPVIVAYQFTAELEAMRAVVPGPVMGDGEEADDEAWNRGELGVMYLHPRSAAHGLNLQYGGHNLVLASQTWSRDDHDQLIARLRRRGSPFPVINVFHLLAASDHRILGEVAAKREEERELLKHLH